MRACQATSAKGVAVPELAKDVAELRKALEGELAAIAAASGAQPAAGARGNELWLGADEAEAAATALRPKLQSARKTTEALLFEVVALEVRCPHKLSKHPPMDSHVPLACVVAALPANA